MSLRKLRTKKVGDAVDVLTEQAGIQDFMPDGGTTDEVYLWYDPGLNAVVQKEVIPGLYAGIFDYEEEAIEFMEQYQEVQSSDISRFELYEAEMEITITGVVGSTAEH